MDKGAQAVYTPIKLAHDIGLFELASILLTAVAILLAIGGVLTFFNFRSVAKAQARDEASAVARSVAEGEAVQYLQREMPALLEAYMELARNGTTDEMADAIAGAQENRE